MLGHTHPAPLVSPDAGAASSGLGFPIVPFSLAKEDWVPGHFCTCLGLLSPGPGLGTALPSVGLPAVTQLGQEPAWWNPEPWRPDSWRAQQQALA